MRRTALAVALATLALVACSNSSATPKVGQLPGCATAAGTTPQGPAAPTTPEPRASIDPNIDDGQQILITEHAFIPHWLTSIVDEDVVWWNQTSKVQRIHYDNGTGFVNSPPIQPGDSFAYRPSDSVSIPYASVDDPHMKGVIQVEPFLDPGETPFTCPSGSG